MNATGSRLSVIAGAALVAAGCQRLNPPAAPPPADHATETVHVERLHETEAVLAQLGRKAWVFKHWGGDVTSDFTIYHRPEGPEQEERAIFTASGDDAILGRRALQKKFEPEGGPEDDDTPARTDRLQLREAEAFDPEGGAEDDDAPAPTIRLQPQEAEDKGYLIVVVPTALPNPLTGSGEIMYNFTLAGGPTGSGSTTTAETVYPKTVFSHSGVTSGSRSVKEPVELTPGETKVLVESTRRFDSKGSETPHLEREMLRFVLRITALKDGQLPKREGKTRPKPSADDGD